MPRGWGMGHIPGRGVNLRRMFAITLGAFRRFLVHPNRSR